MHRVEIIEKNNVIDLQDAVNEFIMEQDDSVSIQTVGFTVIPSNELRGPSKEDWYQAYVTYMS